MIKKIIDFIRFGVWQKNESDFSSGRTWWAVRQFRIILFTARGFNHHDTAIRSAALSFYTILSLVPILALIFVIFKGFGMEETFSNYLHEVFPQYGTIVDRLMIFIKNLLARTHGGIMAVSAFFVLLWAVVRVFSNVEGAFNKIWEVKGTRSLARRFSVYMAIVIIVPILLIAANSVYVGIRTQVELFTGSVVAEILFGLASVVAIVLMFTLVYFIIPDTDVRFVNALKAGAFAGGGFVIFQIAYLLIQSNLSSYNAIYGTFAAIPLFLIWLQTSWQILLFGGELSFAVQNIRDFELERLSKDVSYEHRCKIMVSLAVIVIREFLEGRSLATPESAAAELGIPVRTVRETAYELQSAGLIIFAKEDGADKSDLLLPSRDPRSIRFFDVIASVTSRGGALPGSMDAPLMKRVGGIYDKVKADVGESPDNILLTDLI